MSTETINSIEAITLQNCNAQPEKKSITEKTYLGTIAGICTGKKLVLKANGEIKNHIIEGQFVFKNAEGEVYEAPTAFLHSRPFDDVPEIPEGASSVEVHPIQIFAVPNSANSQGFAVITGRARPTNTAANLLKKFGM